MLLSDKALDGTPIISLGRGSCRKVELKCDRCGVVTESTFGSYMRSQSRRGNTGLTACQPCSTADGGMKKRGKPSYNRGIKLDASKKGKNHPAWKGGTYTDVHGYVMRYVGSSKNKAGWTAYRKEHVLVVEDAIGRRVEKTEVIHHIDGNKVRNDLPNLWLTTHAGHKDAHQSLQSIGYAMVRAGLIGFDPVLGTYHVADHKLRELLEHPGGGNQQPSPDGNDREGPETRG